MSLQPTIDAWEAVEGSPWPLGVTWRPDDGTFNFALYSRYATDVTVLFYRDTDARVPVHTYRLRPRRNKTGRVWHCVVPLTDLDGATLYAYRVDGPRDPGSGHRFDAQRILLDPFAERVYFPPGYDRATLRRARADRRPRASGRAARPAAGVRLGARPATPPHPRPGRSTSSTSRASLFDRTPASPLRSAAPLPAWSRRSPTCRSSGSRRWS